MTTVTVLFEDRHELAERLKKLLDQKSTAKTPPGKRAQEMAYILELVALLKTLEHCYWGSISMDINTFNDIMSMKDAENE